jgi:hypothetical protein
VRTLDASVTQLFFWGNAERFRMPWRAATFLIGIVGLIAGAGVIAWHFYGGRGDALKANGGPVLTVMDFGQRFPARSAPLWLATSEILDTFSDDDVLCGQRRRAKHAVRNS